MKHAAGTELLDDPAADPVAVRRSLGNIARANRLFGGTAAALHGVSRLLSTVPRTLPGGRITLLDLGTGAGDIPAAVRAWGDAHDVTIRTIGLERLRPAARLAATPSLPMLLGCVGALPIRERGVDVVLVSQLLHHLDAATAATLVREVTRLARVGVVIADLQRSRSAAALFHLASGVLGFDEHTRIDGVTSVGRGYTTDGLAAICRSAGVAAEVVARPGWRVVAWWRAERAG